MARRRFIGTVENNATEAGAAVDLSALTLRATVTTLDLVFRAAGSVVAYLTGPGASDVSATSLEPGEKWPEYDVDRSSLTGPNPPELRTEAGDGTTPVKIDVWEVSE